MGVTKKKGQEGIWTYANGQTVLVTCNEKALDISCLTVCIQLSILYCTLKTGSEVRFYVVCF